MGAVFGFLECEGNGDSPARAEWMQDTSAWKDTVWPTGVGGSH